MVKSMGERVNWDSSLAVVLILGRRAGSVEVLNGSKKTMLPSETLQ